MSSSIHNKSLFCYTRLPFVVSSAPGIFQRVIDSIILEILRVIAYFGDILIIGAMKVEHAKVLMEVLYIMIAESRTQSEEEEVWVYGSIEYIPGTQDWC